MTNLQQDLDDDFFSPENRAARRAAELERIAEIEAGWARMDARYAALPPEEQERWDREEAVFEAEREEARIDDAYWHAYRTTKWDDAESCAQMELADAEHTVATDAWRERWGYLWPAIYGEPQTPPDFIYPAGTLERLRAERLEKQITRLQVLREAQLVIEIHETRTAL